MAVSLVQNGLGATGSFSGTAGSMTLTLLNPGSPTNHTVAFISLGQNNNAGGSQTPNALSIVTPSGWTALPPLQGSNTHGIIQVFWKYGFTGTSQVFNYNSTVTNNVSGCGILQEITGCEILNPIWQFASQQFGMPVTFPTFIGGPSITPTRPNCAAIAFSGNDDNTGDMFGIAPTGWAVERTYYETFGNQNLQLILLASFATVGTPLVPTFQIVDYDQAQNILEYLTIFQPPLPPFSASDTGAVVSDSASIHKTVHPTASDTGATVSDSVSIHKIKPINVSDTAATVSDSPSDHKTAHPAISETGATVSDSVSLHRVVHVGISDTAATVSDAPSDHKTVHIAVTDTAATVSDNVVPTRHVARNAASASLDPDQIRTFDLQVFRNGNWISIPVTSAQGQIQKNQAGQLTVVIPNNETDPYRSRLFEGEKVRAYRGTMGAPPIRSWTGFVDVPTATSKIGVSRSFIVTDNIQELNQSMLLQGVIYDTLTPNAAITDVINQAITTGQLVLTDDAGNPLTSTANYNSPTGNQICYFPDSVNADGSLLTLASGTLGSFTNGNNPTTSFIVPGASFAAYSAFELQQQFIIASTFTMYGMTIASAGTPLPPASGQVIVDYYNGIFYFNPIDASRSASFSGFYYSSPLWAFTQGTSCMDVITQILDKSGARWSVDPNGKFYSQYIDTVHAPTRVLGPQQYGQLQVQTNRDRRNVIVCEGWDGNCGQIFVSKCINYDDIVNAPPFGLGKRAYMIIQDPSWKTRATINAAAYYAAQQVGRRGKVMSVNIIDDPTLALENILVFAGADADTSEGDFFYVEGINWQWTLSKNGTINTTSTVTGTGLPGQGTMYIGPTSAMTAKGFFDFSSDVRTISNPTLAPTGGKYYSAFSLSIGLNLNYTALVAGFEAIDIYGSDGSHLGPFQTTRAALPLSVIMPVGSMHAGVWYVIKLRYEDANGNIGIYRTFIQAFA